MSSKIQEEKNMKILRELARLQDNKKCMDCTEKVGAMVLFTCVLLL